MAAPPDRPAAAAGRPAAALCARLQVPAASDYDISVTDPVKQGDGVGVSCSAAHGGCAVLRGGARHRPSLPPIPPACLAVLMLCKPRCPRRHTFPTRSSPSTSGRAHGARSSAASETLSGCSSACAASTGVRLRGCSPPAHQPVRACGGLAECSHTAAVPTAPQAREQQAPWPPPPSLAPFQPHHSSPLLPTPHLTHPLCATRRGHRAGAAREECGGEVQDDHRVHRAAPCSPHHLHQPGGAPCRAGPGAGPAAPLHWRQPCHPPLAAALLAAGL